MDDAYAQAVANTTGIAADGIRQFAADLPRLRLPKKLLLNSLGQTGRESGMKR